MADLNALARVPWIGGQWDLIDLQVDQRGSELRSSLGALRFRVGDHFRLAVFFFDGTGAAVNPSPARLRWTLRDAANLEQISAVALEPATAQTDQPDPYFLLEPNITRLKAAALDLLPEGREVLECVMDLDWTIDGDVYSSQNLRAVIEFGLTLQGGSDVAPMLPVPPPRPTEPDAPPAPPATSVLTTAQLRELFDAWLSENLPTGEGFLYIRNGDIVAAVPGGDCTTGNPWTPT
jgi:hypothetical protein